MQRLLQSKIPDSSQLWVASEGMLHKFLLLFVLGLTWPIVSYSESRLSSQRKWTPRHEHSCMRPTLINFSLFIYGLEFCIFLLSLLLFSFSRRVCATYSGFVALAVLGREIKMVTAE
uniref:Uncharacterized protein n=1 Tax=Opuntia streptacantha TaxID=393608 RepID=A0A7C9AR45_OPUST